MRKSTKVSVLAVAIMIAGSLGLARPVGAASPQECVCDPESGCSVCFCVWEGIWKHCCYACGGATCGGENCPQS